MKLNLDFACCDRIFKTKNWRGNCLRRGLCGLDDPAIPAWRSSQGASRSANDLYVLVNRPRLVDRVIQTRLLFCFFLFRRKTVDNWVVVTYSRLLGISPYKSNGPIKNSQKKVTVYVSGVRWRWRESSWTKRQVCLQRHDATNKHEPSRKQTNKSLTFMLQNV